MKANSPKTEKEYWQGMFRRYWPKRGYKHRRDYIRVIIEQLRALRTRREQ